MKNFIKKHIIKTLSCVALVCAVLFSCVVGIKQPANTKNKDMAGATTQPLVSNIVGSISTVDDSYNLMDEYPLTPENQTDSSLCWSYSSSKALESALMVQANEYYNFSEIAVAYLGYYNSYLDSLNVGGNLQTFDYIAENYGLVFESEFSNDKYFDITEDNYQNYNYVTGLASTSIMDAVDAVYFYVDNNYYGASENEQHIMVKKFIKNYGGLFAGIDEGAIYRNGSTWTYTIDAGINAEKLLVGGPHAICLVGYDANGYIALNSWGAGSDMPYIFYIPYTYTDMLSTLAGFVYNDVWNVEIETTSSQDFEKNTKYKSLENVFCLGEDLELTLSFDDSINFTSVYVDAFKGSQEVSNAFHFVYDDVNRKVTISLTSGVLSFEGGAYTFKVYESNKLLANKSVLVVSGTEIAYFQLSIVSMSSIIDSEYFMNSYLSNDNSVTYYVRPTQDYILTFYLTEMNKFNVGDSNTLSASLSTAQVISVADNKETVENASSLSTSLGIGATNDMANTYTISIKNLSNYQGKVLRLPLKVWSNIANISATRTYYINLIVSNFVNVYTRDAYAVEYVLNGGLNSAENIDRVPLYSEESSMTEFILKAPTKMGETFVGWYLDKDFKTEIVKLSASITSDIVLYAKWEENLVDYFDMTATIADIVKNSNQTEDDIVYGDDIEFEITFSPNTVLSGYNYIVRYYFYINDAQFTTEQIDKDLLKAGVLLEGLTVGDYQVKVVVSVVISHNMSVSEERYVDFEVEKKKVEFTFSNLEYTYDTYLHKPTVSLVDGSVYDDDLSTFDWTLSIDAQKDAGNYDFSVVSLSNENYIISGTNSCQMVIHQKEIAIAWDSLSAYYNKKTQTPKYTLSGALYGDSVSIPAIRFGTMIDVGVYDIEIDKNSVTNANYVISNADDIVFEIKPAEIVLTFSDMSCRVSLDYYNRPPITESNYSIQGTVYQGDSLNLQITCQALTATATDVGEYPITATYSNPNYKVTIIEGVYKLLGSYTVKYTLPNGEIHIEEVTEGENPVGITDDIYDPGLFKKLEYSQELVYSNGQDLDIVVTVKDYTTYVLVGAAVVVVAIAYLAITRKQRRNKVR